ncbi:hypothetical protein KIN20_009746 [Parelaphostrongylus tenuis]|uniref:Uncharacterized protein n=1 Tax=Parelaphostrongylus tenuis TaxID=148309 RepID=A0AAD5QIE0_PARTN|nr:hypothetical protein KIN20_009746 [Parelaphostrongylus tenuis]
MISLIATISTVLGCGVMPAGQASTRMFTVSGITTLPAAMAYSDKPEISAQVPGIASTRDGAQAFVSRLVMQTVLDVLESQARSALLPDFVVSSILGQLSVRVIYDPLPCQKVVFDITKNTKGHVFLRPIFPYSADDGRSDLHFGQKHGDGNLQCNCDRDE